MNKTFASLTVVLLVVFMFATANVINEKEIIFPEIAALGVGAWFIKNSPWCEKPLNLWLSPTFAALTGVVMLHFLPGSQEILLECTFVLVVLQLCLLRSKVLPSISAAILPIVINADSLYYILSVCILSGIIALGRRLLNQFQVNDPSLLQSLKEEPQQGWREIAMKWLILFIGVTIVATIAFGFKWIYVIAPPLIVTFVEFANPSGQLSQRPIRLLGMILAAALSGTLLFEMLHHRLYWPLWISAGSIVLWIFFLYRQFELVFPPAMAISLLPTIIPQDMLFFYPFQVTVGLIVFIIIGKIINISYPPKKLNNIHPSG